jgi:hypothetical protein
MADKVKWQLSPKGATLSELMLAVNARGGAGSTDYNMQELVFSPDLPLTSKSPGTSRLSGWTFTKSETCSFDGAIFFHLGSESAPLNLTAVLGPGPGAPINGGTAPLPPASWHITCMHQPAYATAGAGVLLQNMSSVTREVLVLQPNNILQVPAFSLVRIEHS